MTYYGLIYAHRKNIRVPTKSIGVLPLPNPQAGEISRAIRFFRQKVHSEATVVCRIRQFDKKPRPDVVMYPEYS